MVGAHASNLYSIRSAGQHGPCPSILLGTDINIRAARISNMTYQKNKVLGNAILGDLVSPIYQRLRGEIDVLIFNPPYVPSPVDEMEFRENDPLPVSWAGGRDGREVLDRVLHEIPKLLSPAGVFYLVVIEDNKPEELKKILLESGLSVQVVKQKISFREKLYIFLCTQAR